MKFVSRIWIGCLASMVWACSDAEPRVSVEDVGVVEDGGATSGDAAASGSDAEGNGEQTPYDGGWVSADVAGDGFNGTVDRGEGGGESDCEDFCEDECGEDDDCFDACEEECGGLEIAWCYEDCDTYCAGNEECQTECYTECENELGGGGEDCWDTCEATCDGDEGCEDACFEECEASEGDCWDACETTCDGDDACEDTCFDGCEEEDGDTCVDVCFDECVDWDCFDACELTCEGRPDSCWDECEEPCVDFVCFDACEAECFESGDGDDDRSTAGDVLTIGDSVMEWNVWDNASIADFIADETGWMVANRAISGAVVLDDGPEAIPSQYVSHSWQWVVVEGGANDLGDRCACDGCEEVIDAIVSADGTTGAIPELLDTIAADGAHIALLGYYRLPEDTEFGPCLDEFDVLDGRYEALAASRTDVYFVSMGEAADMVNEPALLDDDRIHPSAAGSEAIGRLIGRRLLEWASAP